MPGPRQPLEVIEATGRKHLSKSERAQRAASEPRSSEPVKRLNPPAWLPKSQHCEFRRVAREIVRLMPQMVSRSDTETIATYCMARQEWLTATARANAALASGDLSAAQGWAQIQDRYFKQVRACANDLGLTVSSRCRMVVPVKDDIKNPFEALIASRV